MDRPDHMETLAPSGPKKRSGCVKALLACGCLVLLLCLGSCIAFGVLTARFTEQQAALDRRLEAAQRSLERPFVQTPDAQLDERRLLAFLEAREALQKDVTAR